MYTKVDVELLTVQLLLSHLPLMFILNGNDGDDDDSEDDDSDNDDDVDVDDDVGDNDDDGDDDDIDNTVNIITIVKGGGETKG